MACYVAVKGKRGRRERPFVYGVRVVRIAALFCGLIAGLFALVAPVGLGIDLLTPFLKLWGSTPGQQLLGTVVFYAPVAAAILGGLLAFVTPGPGALLLLAAGVGWVGFGVFDLSLLRIELLVPGIASITGSLLAFLAGELELRRRRAARRNRRDMLRDTDTLRDSGSMRDPGMLRDPVMSPRGATMPRDAGGRNDDDERAREAAFSMDPLTVTREEAPPRPNREIPLTLEDVVPAEPEPRDQRRRPSETIWPDAPTGRRSMFERDSAPDLQPRRSLFDRPATRVERPPADRRDRPTERRERMLQRESERDRDYRPQRDYADDEPAPRRSLFVWFVAANVVVLIVLGVVVAYVMVDRKPDLTATVAEAAQPAVVATPATTPAVAEVTAEEADRLTPNVWPQLALPGTPEANQPALPMAPGDTPMAATVGAVAATAETPAAVAPAAGTFADPFAYCNAVKTVDYVDNRYSGPRFTADIADALRVPLGSAPDRVSWRCVDGVIYACASFDWPVCSMTPTAQEMLDYCQRNPGVTRLLAPNGTWACEGTKPRIPDGASWPVDARGFFPNAWIPVLPPQRPTG